MEDLIFVHLYLLSSLTGTNINQLNLKGILRTYVIKINLILEYNLTL
jgi:hypothetical protein